MIADIETRYGKIRFEAPPSFQGEIDLSTDFGSVDAAMSLMPFEAEQRAFRECLRGEIGSGEGKLRLDTGFGSVRLR